MEQIRIDNQTAIFENTRPMLLGLAYRLLGSHHDAEDVVQDIFESWLMQDPTKIVRPESWLATACSRKAIDRLRARKRSRLTYQGEWLPEPVRTEAEFGAEQQILLTETLTTAFLVILERLTPKERAAYLLHDIFSTEYQEIARTLAMKEPACRQLVARARKRLKLSGHIAPPARKEQDAIVSAFYQALQAGNIEALKAHLAEDVSLHTDAGGKATAISKPLFGLRAVSRFFAHVLLPAWDKGKAQLHLCKLNGQTGVALYEKGVPTTAFTFDYNRQGQTRAIYIMRNPDKLKRLTRPIDIA